MPKVEFYPDGKSTEVESGTTILQAAKLCGVIIESPCNASGTCGKCRVKLDSGSLANVSSPGRHHLNESGMLDGYVLSCETRVLGDIKVTITNRQKNDTLQILGSGKSFKFHLDTFIKKEYFEDDNATKVYADGKLLGSEPGNTVDRSYGAVVDIGTTTLVTSLVDLNSGKELSSVSSLNPQAIYAQDVLSRIKFASGADGLNVLYSELIGEIDRMIGDAGGKAGIERHNIYEVIFSGNTCMLHLVSNTNPASLGRYPYTPQISGAVHLKACEHNINISDFGIIYLPPIISAYVGADITSGVLASQIYKRTGTTLFVDIGTNGEIVAGLDGKLSATSTAAGPAFEGMNITYGMRAGVGAIELFNVEEDGNISIRTIGGTEASGICGSGLLDIVGELVAYGVIDKNGKFVEPGSKELLPELSERLVQKDGKTVFRLSGGIVLTQKDIRQVQLAKGAVRAGIEFLLENRGVKASDVDKVLIAGSFGYHLRAKSLINIGLLPKEFDGKIEFIGNTSKSGGHVLLLNKSYRSLMEEVVKNVQVVELANYKDFDRVFVKNLAF